MSFWLLKDCLGNLFYMSTGDVYISLHLLNVLISLSRTSLCTLSKIFHLSISNKTCALSLSVSLSLSLSVPLCLSVSLFLFLKIPCFAKSCSKGRFGIEITYFMCFRICVLLQKLKPSPNLVETIIPEVPENMESTENKELLLSTNTKNHLEDWGTCQSC